MIAVIFEVWPAEGQKETYLDLAAGLREELTKIDGFISIERFQSLTDEGKVLSSRFGAMRKQFQRGATSRNTEARNLGRAGVFADYRLRVASIMRDYGMNERSDAPVDSRERHDAKA